MDRRHLRGLDSLRAITAYLVVIYHNGIPWIPAGFGVLTFFVLSGFLITLLLLREFAAKGTISRRKFYLRRSLRIFTGFYVYWLVFVGSLIVFGKKVAWGHAVSAFVYTSNYYQGFLNLKRHFEA